MTITAQEQLSTGSRGSTRTGQETYVEQWIIRQDTGAYTSSAEILASGVLPAFNTRLTGTNAYLTDRRLKPDEKNRSIWYATLSYNTVTTPEESDDPVLLPSRVSYDLLATSKALEQAYQTGDSYGSPTQNIQNSAGDPFDPPVVEEFTDLVIVVEKNYSDFDPQDLGLYCNSVNSAEVTVGGVPIPAEQGWLLSLRHGTQYKSDGTPYDTIRFEIAVRAEGWEKVVPSLGYYHIKDGKHKPILNSDLGDTDTKTKDNEVTVAQKLDTNGLVVVGKDTEPKYIPFKTKYQRDWNPLNLPVRKDGTA